MKKFLFFLLIVSAHTCFASNTLPPKHHTEYYKGSLFFTPKETGESFQYGEQVSKIKVSRDGLVWNCTTCILSPGKQPEINTAIFTFNPDTSIADVKGLNAPISGHAQIVGTFLNWSEVITKLVYEKEGLKFTANLHEKKHDGFISLEEDLYKGHESEDSLIGKFNGTMHLIDENAFEALALDQMLQHMDAQ